MPILSDQFGLFLDRFRLADFLGYFILTIDGSPKGKKLVRTALPADLNEAVHRYSPTYHIRIEFLPSSSMHCGGQ
jgi:hypothetical protein